MLVSTLDVSMMILLILSLSRPSIPALLSLRAILERNPPSLVGAAPFSILKTGPLMGNSHIYNDLNYLLMLVDGVHLVICVPFRARLDIELLFNNLPFYSEPKKSDRNKTSRLSCVLHFLKTDFGGTSGCTRHHRKGRCLSCLTP